MSPGWPSLRRDIYWEFKRIYSARPHKTRLNSRFIEVTIKRTGSVLTEACTFACTFGSTAATCRGTVQLHRREVLSLCVLASAVFSACVSPLQWSPETSWFSGCGSSNCKYGLSNFIGPTGRSRHRGRLQAFCPWGYRSRLRSSYAGRWGLWRFWKGQHRRP